MLDESTIDLLNYIQDQTVFIREKAEDILSDEQNALKNIDLIEEINELAGDISERIEQVLIENDENEPLTKGLIK